MTEETDRRNLDNLREDPLVGPVLRELARKPRPLVVLAKDLGTGTADLLRKMNTLRHEGLVERYTDGWSGTYWKLTQKGREFAQEQLM